MYAADPVDDVLSVTVRQDIPYPGTTEVTVVVGPADGAWAKRQLAVCAPASPGRSQPLYSSLRPGVFLLASTTLGNAVLAENAALVAMASANAMPTEVTTATLIAVAASLCPVGAATLAGLAG